MGFPATVASPGCLVPLEATPEVPVYLDAFLLPLSILPYFPQIDSVKIGHQGFKDLAFAPTPENPNVATATPPRLVRVRAGEKIQIVVGNIAGHSMVLRCTALVYSDAEDVRS
jgi:hypothetical protein